MVRRFAIQSKAEMAGAGLLILAVVIAFGPIIHSMMTIGLTDFPVHLSVAEAMVQTRKAQTAYPVYELLVAGVHSIMPRAAWEWSAFLVTLSFYVFLSIVLYVRMCNWWGSPTSYKSSVAYTLMTIALMVVTPISLFIPDGHLFFGYISINVYHNPTILVLKPLAVLLFFYALQVFRQQARNSGIQVVVGAALLTIVSALAKPNYVICLLPALSVWALIAGIRKRRVDWWLMGGIVIPGVAVLAWQYYITYTSPTLGVGASGVLFAPFKVFRYYSSWLFPKFVLSILFPASVYALYFKQARRSLALNFAWLGFAIGAAYTYLLAEDGERMMHGNFAGSGLITLFILFVISTLFFVCQEQLLARSKRSGKKTTNKAMMLCAAAFGLHLVSGIIWYLVYLLTPDNPRW